MSFNESDNNNRYHFDLTPMDDDYRQQDTQAAEQKHHNEMNALRRSMTKVIAVCCAITLVLGIGGGAIVGNMVSKNNRSAAVTDTSPAATSAANTQSFTQSSDSSFATTAKSNSGSSAENLYATTDGDSSEMSSADVYDLVSPTVVSINTEYQSSGAGYYGQSATSAGAGSGVIISADGYIVTNNHVIESATKISVSLSDDESYDAVLVGTDDVTDIALLKIEASDLHYAVIGDSDALRIGDKVNVIGNALGELSGTLTVGYVSGLDRDITMSDGTTMNLLQMDAAVNPGNSGGGVFNTKGELIGITDAKMSSTEVEGLGFAIPVTDILPILDDLRVNGYVTGRPALGISIVTISDAMTAMMYRVSYLGVYVNNVYTENGLQAGDYLISIDDTQISSSADITGVLQKHVAGDTVAVKVYRNNAEQTIQVTLIEEGTMNTETGFPTQNQNQNQSQSQSQNQNQNQNQSQNPNQNQNQTPSQN